VLLEREEELERIDAALDAAREGRGGALLIEGPAGIGKTSLVAEARRRAQARGMLVLHGRGTELEREYALGVVRQALQPAVRAAGPLERGRLLAGVAAHAAPVVLDGVHDDDASTPFAMLHGLYWLVANMTANTPGLVVVDDAQWADEPSLRFLAFLVRRVESLAATVLIAARPDERLLAVGALGEARADPALEILAPRALSEAAVAELLGVAGREVADTFARACRDATGGNPFLLGHLAASLRAEGVAFDGGAAAGVAQVTPPEVARSVRRALGRVDADAVALAQAIAVLGDDVPLDELAELAGLGRVGASGAATQLAAAGLLEDHRPLRFRHPLLRAAMTAAMTDVERDRGHRRAAELLAARGASVERQALHLRLVEPDGSAVVVGVLRSAARRASDRGAPEPAIALLERALAEPPPDQLRHELLIELAEAEHAAGRDGRAFDHAAEAHGLAPDTAARARALALWGAAARPDVVKMGELAPLVDRALTEVGDGDRELALHLRSHALETALVRPPDPERLERLSRGAGDLRGDTPGEAAVLGLYVLRRSMAADATAAEVGELAERAARQADWLQRKGPDVLAFAGVVFSLRWCERMELVQRLNADAMTHARRRGNAPAFDLALVSFAEVSRRCGRLREAEGELRAATDTGPDWTVAQIHGLLAACLLDQGHPADASRVLLQTGLTGPLGLAPPLTEILLARMRIRAACGETQAALADWHEALARPRGGPRAAWIESYVVAAETLSSSGDTGAARELAAEALDLARRWGAPGAIGEALRGVARVGDGGDAIELLREAVEQLQRSHARLGHARALVDLGAALRRRGDRRDAREPLKQGLELADECGADGVAEIARQELAASGVRVRRRTPEGADLLTVSERRIAALAAEGTSNAEIAQSLFVTIKTVEMHLTHSYRKLAITRRSQLAGALQRN